MGRTTSRLELRRMNEAAEKIEQEREAEEGAEASTTVTKKTRKKAATTKAATTKTATKKAPVKRKSRAAAKEVRMKAFWGVFNQSLKRVALFEYADRAAADTKATDLSASQKTPHFVQVVKEPIVE